MLCMVNVSLYYYKIYTNRNLITTGAAFKIIGYHYSYFRNYDSLYMYLKLADE